MGRKLLKKILFFRIEQRCPLAQYGCPFSHRRIHPAHPANAALIHSSDLQSFGVAHVDDPAHLVGHSSDDYLSQMPDEILMRIGQSLDGMQNHRFHPFDHDFYWYLSKPDRTSKLLKKFLKFSFQDLRWITFPEWTGDCDSLVCHYWRIRAWCIRSGIKQDAVVGELNFRYLSVCVNYVFQNNCDVEFENFQQKLTKNFRLILFLEKFLSNFQGKGKLVAVPFRRSFTLNRSEFL